MWNSDHVEKKKNVFCFFLLQMSALKRRKNLIVPQVQLKLYYKSTQTRLRQNAGLFFKISVY